VIWVGQFDLMDRLHLEGPPRDDLVLCLVKADGKSHRFHDVPLRTQLLKKRFLR
jgi:hypothetical protein